MSRLFNMFYDDPYNVKPEIYPSTFFGCAKVRYVVYFKDDQVGFVPKYKTLREAETVMFELNRAYSKGYASAEYSKTKEI